MRYSIALALLIIATNCFAITSDFVDFTNKKHSPQDLHRSLYKKSPQSSTASNGRALTRSYNVATYTDIETTLTTGSLQNNIARIAKQNGWPTIIWHAPDYRWLGKTKISAPNLQMALQQILHNYPLQAVFYTGNHILLIQPRIIR